MGWVYAIQSGELIKVGMSKSVAGRLETISIHNPHCRLVHKVEVGNARIVEKRAHKTLKAHARGHEWFAITPADARAAIDEAALWGSQIPPSPVSDIARKIRGNGDLDA
jgi:hypothetical protein